VIFVENDSKNAAFHFSVEEFFTRHQKFNEPVLMLWQAEKTVMIGNNQVVAAEVNLKYADESGICIVRRSSGGGAIYTDSGTVLVTIIEPLVEEMTVHRENFAAALIKALVKMGVSVYREGINDILMNGKKISGLAQYATGDFICTHGSILYDTDLDVLTEVLIPNESKLKPKGISSIRSRVGNIKPFVLNNLPVNGFIETLKNNLLYEKEYKTYNLNNNELNKINLINNEKYANNEWNFRNGY